MAKAKISVIRWRGDGSGYVPGIPQRDLTIEEWATLTEAQRTAAIATGLYELSEAANDADKEMVTDGN